MEDKLKEGEALFAEGKIEEAEKCFLKILESDSKNKEVWNNLGVIAFQKQNTEEAVDYFNRALEIDPFYRDAVLNYFDVLRSLNLIHKIPPFLERVIQKYPDDQELSQLLHEARLAQRPRTKIAVLCLPGLQSFLGDIVDYLKTKYDVRTCYSNNNQEIESAVQWADLVWLEWANELTVALTNHSTLLDGKHIVCRLHSYEAFSGYAEKINWEKISDLIFVAEHIKDIVVQQVPDLLDKVKNVHIVPNGVNLDKFFFKDRSKGKNLAYVGHINYKKGPMLLLHAFRELVQVDEKYRLVIGGHFQDDRYKFYFDQMIREMDLENNIQMDGWIEDVGTWLDDKQYIVCTSVLEGHPVGLMEAMACGLKPVIHNFVGAKGFYPEKYLWNTIPEFIKMITEFDYNSIEYRKFIEKHYSLETQLEKVRKIVSNTAVAKGTKNQWVVNTKNKPFDIIRDHKNQDTKISQEDVKSYYNHFLDYLKRDHECANLRHQQAKETLKNIIRSKMKVLDIGCGTGITSRFMGELGANVVGVDISDKLIAFAQNNSAHQNTRYIVADATQLNLQERFDAVTIIDSMEHILRRKLDDYFQAISRHISEETIIYLNIPDGRYQRHMRLHHPERLQIVDEDYDPDFLISSFRKIGFQPYQISIYGIDVPVQYNEYIFMTEHRLKKIYEKALKKFGL